MKDYGRDDARTTGEGSHNISRTATVPGSRILSQESIHQAPESGYLANNGNHQSIGINSSTRTHLSNHVVQADVIGTTNRSSFSKTYAEPHLSAPAADNMCNGDKLDVMEDDDILAVRALIL